uniref:Uncharacterized protein n=1 Tax=Klebsiella pneumoniae TaxID=573 RepID=A0A5P1PMC2_KLEPN|nr:hypothetical protein [Klebsiella pneumoniae]QEQ70509.1 hypothetical protein [Klebsiella pneumoniae]QIK04253.1 hypothetical protein [Klebsiella pneumoniae]QVQ57549.1 hypothetical protein [Klebsiella pneumoniae]
MSEKRKFVKRRQYRGEAFNCRKSSSTNKPVCSYGISPGL